MTTEIRVRRRRYHWPEAQLNFWMLIMIAAAATTLGIFAYFISVQNTLEVGIPWFVSPSSFHPQRLTHKLTPPQDLPLRSHHLRPSPPLPLHHDSPHFAKPAPPRHNRPGLLHSLRPMAHRPNRNLHPTLRPQRQREQLLQFIPKAHRTQREHPDLVADERSLPRMESRLRV